MVMRGNPATPESGSQPTSSLATQAPESKFMPIDSNTFPADNGWYQVAATDFNHNGTRQQGMLLNLLYNTMERMGPVSDYYYFLYNEKPGENCDLEDMYTTYFHSGSVISVKVERDSGLVFGDMSGFRSLAGVEDGSSVPGTYWVDSCNMRLVAVRSTGDIPESAWQEGLRLAQQSLPKSETVK